MKTLCRIFLEDTVDYYKYSWGYTKKHWVGLTVLTLGILATEMVILNHESKKLDK